MKLKLKKNVITTYIIDKIKHNNHNIIVIWINLKKLPKHKGNIKIITNLLNSQCRRFLRGGGGTSSLGRATGMIV